MVFLTTLWLFPKKSFVILTPRKRIFNELPNSQVFTFWSFHTFEELMGFTWYWIRNPDLIVSFLIETTAYMFWDVSVCMWVCLWGCVRVCEYVWVWECVWSPFLDQIEDSCNNFISHDVRLEVTTKKSFFHLRHGNCQKRPLSFFSSSSLFKFIIK